VMNSCFSQFTTPEKNEGFDDVRYEWDACEKAKEYLKVWVQNKKLNTRIEDLQPGQFFNTKNSEFGKLFVKWQDHLKTLDPAKKPAPMETGGEDEEDLDVFSVKDIMNIGDDLPLFSKFNAEDWALVQLRFELHMLTTSFKKDCDDPDRAGVPLDHVSFYYYKYFNKVFCPRIFGMTEGKGIFNMIKDTVTTKDVLLVSQLDEATETFDIFVKLTEAARRERERRIEAGDETARLKYQPSAARDVVPEGLVPVQLEGRYSGGPVVPAVVSHGGYGPRGGKDKGKGKGKKYRH